MSLPLTPEMIAAAYDFLCTTPPFSRWNLPDSEDVAFKVIRKDWQGHHQWRYGQHIIAVSSLAIGHTHSLMMCVAHEMIHLHQRETDTDTLNVDHNAAFKKYADRACKVHGWDEKLFSY